MLTASEIDVLLDQVGRGSRDSFRFIVRAFSLPLRSYIASQVHHPNDVDDMTQEVFLAAWKQLDRFRGRASFRTWLHAIALRQCAASARSARGRPSSLDDPEASEPPSSEGASAQALLERREQDAALHAAVHTLPRAQREAVVLHYFGGLTCAETAAAMRISAGAVMTHLFRARKSLRDALSWLVDEEASR